MRSEGYRGGVRNTLHTRNPLRQRSPPQGVKDAIHERDRTKLTAKCSEKAPMIAEVVRGITWSRLWDSALDLGDKSVKGLQYLSRAMSHHGCGNHPCPLCDTAPLPVTVLDHLLDCHSSSLFLNPTLSSDGLIDLLQQLHLSVLCNFSSFILINCVFVLTLGCIDELLNFTVVVLCVCLCVCLSGYEAAYERYQQLQCYNYTRARKLMRRFC